MNYYLAQLCNQLKPALRKKKKKIGKKIFFFSEIRAVLHHVRTQVGNQFPEAGIQAVGAFIFLRFICPAIFIPNEYGIQFGKKKKFIL